MRWTSWRKVAAIGCSVAACAGAVVGCGGTNASSSRTGTPSRGSASQGSAAGSVLQVATDSSGKLMFIPAKLSAKAGKVTITLSNHSTALHSIAIRRGPLCRSEVRCDQLSLQDVGSTDSFNNGSRTLTVNLTPGTYTFYCTVPGHALGGMQGTLTVSR